MNFLRHTLLILSVTVSVVSVFSQQTRVAKPVANNNCDQIDQVISQLKKYHYDPVEITGAVNKEILEIYFGEADARNRVFSTDQLEKLSAIAGEKGLCAAYEESRKMYYAGIHRYDSLLHVFTKNPVKFVKGEKIKVNAAESKHLRKTEAQMKAHLQQQLKLSYMYIGYNQFEEDSIAFTDKTLTPQLDQKWREKLQKREEIFLQRILSDSGATNQKLFNHFLNSIAMRFDPHSSYFNNEEMSSFEGELSKETTSFGIQLVENENFEIEITDILPGSAAWFSGEFSPEDIIESIQVPEGGEKFELTFKGMSNLYRILKNPNYPELDFNLRKPSGEKVTVHLAKTEIENVDNSFKGYLVKEGDLKMGYIALPSFYTDFESDAMLGCANDVTKEILLLKKEGISGLVLDLRNNGGGSIKEAVELCGLFVTEGPVCMLQGSDMKPFLLKDMNRGTVYDGPLVILVNNTSASASEVVSGCLQDYHRALIVGDVTYGKGSAQSMYPVDKILTEHPSVDPNLAPNGYLKITDSRFYHVSSRSNQAVGIVPDVIIKDVYAGVDFFREKYVPYRLSNDSTAKKVVYNKFPEGLSAANKLAAQQRIDQDPAFRRLREAADSLKNFVEQDVEIPLEILPFVTYNQKKDAFNERLEDLQTRAKTSFSVSNVAFHQKMLDLNPVDEELNNEVLEMLEKDLILQETISIFRDFYTFAR